VLDTKFKSSKRDKIVGMVISFLLLSAIAVGIISSYNPILENSKNLEAKMEQEEQTKKVHQKEIDKSYFSEELFRGNYSLYLDILQKDTDYQIVPNKVFLSTYADDISGEDEWVEDREMFFEEVNNMFYNWKNNFYSGTITEHPLKYYMINNKTKTSLSNATNSLNLLMEDTGEALEVKKKYPFYVVMNYKADGTLEIPYYNGIEEDEIARIQSLEMNNELFMELSYNSDWYQYCNQIESPADVTIIYASESYEFFRGYSEDYDNVDMQSFKAFCNGGFLAVGGISFLCVLLLVLVLPLKKSWGIGKGRQSRISLEFSIAGVIFSCGAFVGLAYMALKTAKGDFLDLGYYFPPYSWINNVAIYGLNFLALLLVLTVLFISGLSLLQVFSMGLKKYLKERTITGRLILWTIKKTKSLFKYLGEIDLTDSSNKAIIKILAVNFLILMVLCSIWFMGIVGLIIYTIILFIILKKYFNDIKKKYAILLEATSNMAVGNLEVKIEEDLGVFEPLKEEFCKVQFGFKKAVEEEMKSQKMKTELITNVSHDLKTPLTAIITYVGLLKEDNITDQEKESYIETLDKKSQRLKHLIEDLFEISKASSENVTLKFVEVDLGALIKQVELELENEITQSNVEIRYNLPDKKVVMNLDSEKTYRIFENLMINIVKYSMPHTRAYIELKVEEEKVTVTLKNISAVELDFKAEEISERFVRGDDARNTEGSGLGLAIVKSFVELQGGEFEIILDGDLFKVVIQWSKGERNY
jgi:signal transduction histidine kinase